MSDVLRVLGVYPETIVDGEGIRCSIYFSGCAHKCAGCHNPESWNPDAGTPLADMEEKIFSEIKANPLLEGVTLSGGDPLYNPEAIFEFLKRLKRRTRANVWCYTGYTYDEILKSPLLARCLPLIDVLVDGRFVAKKKDPRLSFRGSSNQRVIRLKNGRMSEILYAEEVKV